MGNAPPPPLGAALLLHATGSPSSGLRIRSFGGDEATTRLKNDDGFTTLALASPALADSWITHLAVGEASLDSFVHDPHGPVFTGSGDFGGCQWPVKTGSFADTRNKTCCSKWRHWC